MTQPPRLIRQTARVGRPAINHKFERNGVVDPNWTMPKPEPAHYGTAKQNFVEQDIHIVRGLGTMLY